MNRHTKHIFHNGEEHVVIYNNFYRFGQPRLRKYFMVPRYEYQTKYADPYVKIPPLYAINRDIAKSLFDLPHLPGTTGYPDDWANANYNNPLNQ